MAFADWNGSESLKQDAPFQDTIQVPDLKKGLCNGTHLVIRQLHNNVMLKFLQVLL